MGLCCLVAVLLGVILLSLMVLAALIHQIKTFSEIFNYIFRVDSQIKRHGGEIVADVLKAHDVKFLFTLCGGHISPILVASEKRGIRIIDTRHEVTTVFAADAVARLSQRIGVACVTAGPGVTNTVTAMKNAQMAESPVLLLGGAAAGLTKGRGALQDIDQLSLFRPICKFAVSVKRIQDIAPILQKAIYIARSGTPGPVFVEFPIDVLYPYDIVRRELGMIQEPKSFGQKVTNCYLEFYLARLFSRNSESFDVPKKVAPLKPSIPLAGESQVSQCAALLMKSERPLILFGSQATLPPVKPDELRNAVEALGVPCFFGGMTRGLIGRGHKLTIHQERKTALKEADLVILAGSVCDFRLSYGRVLNRRASIIAINRNREQLYKNSDAFWKPTLAVQADAGDFMVRLSQLLQERDQYKGASDAWLNTLRQRDDEKEAKNKQEALKKTDKHLNALRVLHDLDDVLTDDTIMVADGGDFVGSAAYILRPRGALKWLDPGAFGTLGVGAGFALGAKLCHPDCPVWIIFGDGSLGYSLSEFDTFVRHQVPVVAIVGNDACWSQIAREQAPMFGSTVACQLEYTRYDKTIEAFGADGILLSAENEMQLADELKRARRLNEENGKTVLVNAFTGKSSFREGSISV